MATQKQQKQQYKNEKHIQAQKSSEIRISPFSSNIGVFTYPVHFSLF